MKKKQSSCRALKITTLALAFALTQGGLVAQTVPIPDPDLEAVIRRALEKPEGDITVADMESLTELDNDNDWVNDLTGLEKATNLTNLSLNFWSYHDLTDLSPLAGLTKLTKLWIGGTQLTDISPLAGLTNLTDLWLGTNYISDISPLAGLANLTDLSLGTNYISDISPLAGLTSLTYLNLSYNKIRDISPLAGLTNLTGLDLSYNLISDISPLAGLTDLRDFSGTWPGLTLDENYIDITPGSPARQVIDSLNAIEGLTVVFEPQNDPEPIIGGVRLRSFYAWYFSDWFGIYGTAYQPWIYHAEHGFLYRHPQSTTASTFFYDDAMDAWWWTNSDVYPFIYVFNPPADNVGTDVGSCWMYYIEGSSEPRSFGIVTGASAGQFLSFDP